MDPAGPLFYLDVPFDRLDEADAKFVQVIHTCAGRLGFNANLGDVDYWVNGGHQQAGCPEGDTLGICSHARSFLYFAESLITGNFKAWKCSSYEHFQNGSCNNSTESYFGQVDIDTE